MAEFKNGDPVWIKGIVHRAEPNDEGDMELRTMCGRSPKWQPFVHSRSTHVIHRTEDEPYATGPAFVAEVVTTWRAAPERGSNAQIKITIVTAAGHRLDLPPWSLDALREVLR